MARRTNRPLNRPVLNAVAVSEFWSSTEANANLCAVSKVSLADVLELSVAERIRLVEDIWDSIATSTQPLPLTQAQREELDRRLEDYEKPLEEGSTWEEVRSRILGMH